MKHVVIGGCGFIGYNLSEYLLNEGHQVVVLDNLSRRGTTMNLSNLNSKSTGDFTFEQCDIRLDNPILEKHIADADVVYHLAAQVAVTTSVVNPLLDFEINLKGTFNILEAARKTKSKAVIIYASTNKVYGGMEEIRIENNGSRYYYVDYPDGISESQQLDFHSPYGCSKGGAEQYIRDYSRIYGLKTICFRQSCIYGPNQFGIEDQGWVAWFTIAAIYNKSISIYGDGMQVRDVLHVSDLIQAYQACVDNIDKTNGQIYNLGGGRVNVASLLELLNLLEEKIGRDIPYKFADWRPGDQPVYISDIKKITTETNWKPLVSFDQGIDTLIEWVQSNKQTLKSVGII